MDANAVKHIASLARLEISEEEAEEFSKEFSEVLEMFNRIDGIECEGEMVLPFGVEPSLRDDTPSGEKRNAGYVKGPKTV